MARSTRAAAPSKNYKSERPSTLRLNAFSSKLTDFQRKLLDTFWKHFREHEKWPLTRVVHSKLDTHKVCEALRPIGGAIVREAENPPNDTYELSLVGVLMTSEGESYRRLLLRYLEFLRDQFISNPEKLDFSGKEIQRALSLSDAETVLLGKLMRLEHSLGFGGSSEKSWSARAPKEVQIPAASWPTRHRT